MTNNKTKQKSGQSKVTYDSIGGLSEQIKAVREMVELPLFHPERFTIFDLAPPKGLLLYGPPGIPFSRKSDKK